MSRANGPADASPGLGPSTLPSCPALFTVEVIPSPGKTVLTLHGELDISTRQLFASALAGLDENVSHVVLDLSDLEFIDCGNIGLICRYRKSAGLQGKHFELRDPNPLLLRIFELTGLSASNGDGALRIPPPGTAREGGRPNGLEIRPHDQETEAAHGNSYA